MEVGEQIAAELAGQMPEPDVQTDRYGRAFDPSIHLTNGDGSPRLTKNGKVRARKGAGGPSMSPGVEPTPANAEAQAAGAVAAQCVFLLCSAIGGPDWIPSAPEAANMNAAFGAYCEAKGIVNIPPEVILAGAMIAYIQPRLAAPERRERIKLWFGKIWYKIRRRKPDARSDSRDNGLRENHAGDANGVGIRESRSESYSA